MTTWNSTPLSVGVGRKFDAATWNAYIRDFQKAWTDPSSTYTPALAGTGWALGTTGQTANGWYWRVGKFAEVWAELVFGTAGQTFGAGQPTISLPAGLTAHASHRSLVDVEYEDVSASAVYRGLGRVAAGGTVIALVNNASPLAALTSTVPFTWATGDKIRVAGRIEVQ